MTASYTFVLSIRTDLFNFEAPRGLEMHYSIFLSCLAGMGIGTMSGMLGIGGGIMVIPALTMLFGFSHKQAVGTSVAMLLPPIGIFAFITYWRAGTVDLTAALWLALGFAVGAFIGSWIVSTGWIPEQILQRCFAIFMLYVAGNILFKSDVSAYAAVQTYGLMAIGAGAYLLARMQGRRWERGMTPADIYRSRAIHGTHHDFEI